MYLYTKTCLDASIFWQIEGMYCVTEGVEWLQVLVLGRRVHRYIDRAQFSTTSVRVYWALSHKLKDQGGTLTVNIMLLLLSNPKSGHRSSLLDLFFITSTSRWKMCRFSGSSCVFTDMWDRMWANRRWAPRVCWLAEKRDRGGPSTDSRKFVLRTRYSGVTSTSI